MAITATTMTMDDLRSRRFEALFEAHHGAVRAYALRRADAETAGDAVADTFLVAWRRLDDIPDEPLPWLYGVARRALADQHRSARRRFVLRERAAAHATASAEADIPDRLGERDAARAALATLSATDREALALVAWEGLEPAEAAAAAECSKATFAVRLFRARRRLAAALDQQETP